MITTKNDDDTSVLRAEWATTTTPYLSRMPAGRASRPAWSPPSPLARLSGPGICPERRRRCPDTELPLRRKANTAKHWCASHFRKRRPLLDREDRHVGGWRRGPLVVVVVDEYDVSQRINPNQCHHFLLLSPHLRCRTDLASPFFHASLRSR